MIPHFGPVELIIILVIVTILFGVGRFSEVFGAVGRGVREFRKNAADLREPPKTAAKPAVKLIAESAEPHQGS